LRSYFWVGCLTKFSNVALIAYSEILLKSDAVRKRLEDLLVKQIRLRLKLDGLNFWRIRKEGGRIYILGENPEEICRSVLKVFGVDFSASALETETGQEEIVENSLKLAEKILGENESFAVRARRVGKHPYTSKDLEVKIGSTILKKLGESKSLKVNLENPDKTIFVEAREKKAYIYSKIFRGWGGLPVGSQGRLLIFLGNNVKTALAGWLMMKRGVFPIPFYLNQTNKDEEDFRFAKTLKDYISQPNLKVYVAPFKKILDSIPQNINSNLKTLLIQRLAVKVGCKLANLKKALGIVLGVSLDPKPTQTLRLLSYLEDASTLPIFHPLIGFEKKEIEDLRLKLNFPENLTKKTFFDFSPPENYNGITDEKLKNFEEKIDVEKLVEKIVNEVKVVKI